MPVERHRWRPLVPRLPRLIATIIASLSLAACVNDRPAAPGGMARASLRITRQTAFGAQCAPLPAITLSRARVLLRAQGSADSIVATTDFRGDTATLQLNIPVSGGPQVVYTFRIGAVDAAGDTVFRGADTATIKVGTPTTVDYLQLWYSAPDSAVNALALAPRDTAIRFGDAFPFRATGSVSGTAFGGRLRVGWASRDTTLATITAAGQVTAKGKPGTAWIVGGTYNSACDSTTVVVVPPVASVMLVPDTLDIARGSTAQLVAVLKDANGNVLVGRRISYQSLNPALASVDTLGVVTALAANQSVRVVATSEGKADTAGIGLLPKPAASIAVSPKSGAVSQGSSITLGATVYDAQGQPNPDWTVAWSSLDPALASVDATGKVTGLTAGTAHIVAAASTVADTASITVNGTGVTSVAVSPPLDTLVSLGDTVQLTAQAYSNSTPVSGTFTWVSRNPAIVTVTANGGVTVAIANGSTYVVATEAAGVKDSAKLVVQQKVATVSVSPTPVQRYLGTQQQFSAQAFDARANAMIIGAFTWSVSDPSIASINGSGLAQMLALGIDTVKASVGTVAGKAVLTVKSPITRIAVTPGGITLDALGKTQAYSAVAHDTLGVAMTAIAFTWSSSNPSVATVPGTSGTSQTATAVANGTTAIQATAQGVTGSAALTVAQLLVSIAAGPTPTTVGLNGQAVLTARGLDANGFYIPGGSFSWASDAPTNVSVGLTTGVVTGLVLNSSAHITASSGAITSNQVLVNVDNAVPARISWGRDTVAVGRGSSNNSLPLYLSKPPVATIIVAVSSKDTIGSFSPTTVTFSAGVTTANANLNARNAGATLIFAVDGSGTYGPDTAVLLVQANAQFSPAAFALNATDYEPAQVLLTDPAPTGGSYITFGYGTSGIAQLSPDPAFIPAGQLAVNVNVNGLAGGNTTITPSSQGISGTASTAFVSAAVLAFSTGGNKVIGAGQYDNGDYVFTPRNQFHPLPITFASSDTSIATQDASATVNAGIYYAFFTAYGRAVGTVTQTASASGWTAATRTLRISTPHLAACCGTSINTTTPPRTMSIATTDSIGTSHYRINPLFISVRSSDTTVVRVIDTTVTVNAGAYLASARYQGVGGGVASVRVTAAGHAPDSIAVSVSAPPLAFNFVTGVIGADQRDVNFGYVSIPNAVGTPVVVALASADTTIAAVSAQITIPIGATVQYFEVRGHTRGSAALTATAAGYTPANATIRVATPRLGSCCSVSVPNFYPDIARTEATQDSLGTSRVVLSPVTITYTSRTASVATMDSASVVVPAGQYFNNHAKLQIRGVGTTYIVATAAGYVPDSFSVTVTMPSLSASHPNNVIGLRQHWGTNAVYVSTPNARADSVEVHFANKAPARATFPDSVKIPVNASVGYFDYFGIGLGKDTVIASATGYNPVPMVATVSTPVFAHIGLGTSYTTTSPPATTSVYAEDTVGQSHYTMDTVAVRITSSDSTVAKVDSALVHILKDQYISTPAHVQFVGPGTVRIAYVDSAARYRPDTTPPITVTGPSLSASSGTTVNTPFTLGMRQHAGSGGFYVSTPNAVTGQPLTVNLLSTDTSVATVAATTTIPVGQTIGYFDIVAHDTIGTVQVKMSATGYAPAVAYVQVGHPQLLISTSTSAYTTSPPGSISVYAADQTGTTRYTTENVAVTLTSGNGSVAAPDSATVTIAKDGYLNSNAKLRYLAPGTLTLTASDGRAAFYAYTPVSTGTITVRQPTVALNQPNASLGLDQYIDDNVTLPTSESSDVVVTLSHTSAATSTPSTVTIPSGQFLAAYRITGVSRGVDKITSSAPNHQPDSATITVDSGAVQIPLPASVAAGDSVQVTLYTYDPSNLTTRPNLTSTTFTLSHNANVVFHQSGAVITTITVPANGSGTSTFYVVGVSPGTGSIAADGGRYRHFTNSLTVTP